jgi:hypothetical protein
MRRMQADMAQADQLMSSIGERLTGVLLGLAASRQAWGTATLRLEAQRRGCVTGPAYPPFQSRFITHEISAHVLAIGRVPRVQRRGPWAGDRSTSVEMRVADMQKMPRAPMTPDSRTVTGHILDHSAQSPVLLFQVTVGTRSHRSSAWSAHKPYLLHA